MQACRLKPSSTGARGLGCAGVRRPCPLTPATWAMDSDVDIAGILSAAAALPRAAAEDDSDHDLGDVLAVVNSLDMQRARFARRSHLLMKHARACKELARAKRGLQVADHVLQRIEVHNQDMAKTREDIIDVTEKVPVKHRGKGSYRHWVPSALLRVCWGLKPRQRILKIATHRPRRRLQGKRCVPRAVAPTVASARTCAACLPWRFSETAFGWFRFGRVLGMKRVSFAMKHCWAVWHEEARVLHPVSA